MFMLFVYGNQHIGSKLKWVLWYFAYKIFICWNALLHYEESVNQEQKIRVS